MKNYISELKGALLLVGSAETEVGKATELVRPLAECVADRMHLLVVEPLPNGEVLCQGRCPAGKPGIRVVSRVDAHSGMGVANALYAAGVRLPRWAKYAVDQPSYPVVVYWREKSIR